MRMRLTPDASKMVISTRNGYLVVVHDLDLDTMSEDLAGQSAGSIWSCIITNTIHALTVINIIFLKSIFLFAVLPHKLLTQLHNTICIYHIVGLGQISPLPPNEQT